MKCWGNNAYGQLGNGTTTAANQPIDVIGLSGVKAIAAGGSHACAITATDNVKCWGANSWGQLGNKSFAGSKVPVDVLNLSQVRQISLGDALTTVLWGNGRVRQFGKLQNQVLTPAPPLTVLIP